jgi:tRNA pseudouridine55 synthase
LVDKPPGITSHDVVQRVRRILGTKAVGHTGTLDPFATGLLVVLVGKATRLARFVERRPKTYVATVRLGVRTDTDDLTGRITQISEAGESVDPARVVEALAEFVGTGSQRPPEFSAKHVGGERSYQKARRGEMVQLEPVEVTVSRLEVLECRPPEVTFRVVVSAGTYIRAIARDLGERLGLGAHLTSLRREGVGLLRVEDAVSLEQLSVDALIPPRVLLDDMPTVHLDAEALVAVSHGRAVEDRGAAGQRDSGAVVALMGQGQLVAVARAENGWLRPSVVLGAP